jgi:hypothetical protein
MQCIPAVFCRKNSGGGALDSRAAQHHIDMQYYCLVAMVVLLSYYTHIESIRFAEHTHGGIATCSSNMETAVHLADEEAAPIPSSSETSRQCGVCHGLRYSVERFNGGREYIRNSDRIEVNKRKIEDFQESSVRGCRICAFLAEVVIYFETDLDSHALFYLNIERQSRVEMYFPQSAMSVHIYTPMGKNSQ